MGTPKGLLDYQGHPWLLEQLFQLSRCGHPQAAEATKATQVTQATQVIQATKITLVLGYHLEEYLTRIPELKHGLDADADADILLSGVLVRVVVNHQPELGPFSSIVAGLQAQQGGNSPAFILPVDVPCPNPSVWRDLRDSMHAESAVALPSCITHGEKRTGHPVLLSPSFQEALLQLPLEHPEARLDFQIRSLPPNKIVYVPVADRKTVLNLNSPFDWDEYKNPPPAESRNL